LIYNDLISVIIPVYNRELLISDAINSILHQTYKYFEIIVVDDNSTDGTENEVKKITDKRIVYIKQEFNQGPSAARNKGVKESKGNLIAFLDSDDVWDENKLNDQINILKTYKEKYDIIFCGFRIIDFKTKMQVGERIIKEKICKNFKDGKYFITPQPSTMLIKKSAFVEVGGFDEKLKANEDTELAIKLCKKGYKFFNQEYSLVSLTRNHSSLMGNNKNYIEAWKIILEKHKDFLSGEITFSMCKQIANYYILINNLDSARKYVKKAINIFPFKISAVIQIILLTIFPSLLKFLYSKKYKKIPNISGI